MNNILKDVEELKQKVIDSNEYKDFKKYEKILDNDKEIKKVINQIKKVQQSIIKKEDKNENTDKDQIELSLMEKCLP